MPQTTYTFTRDLHKGFIDRLTQGTPAAPYSTANTEAIAFYTKGFLYQINIINVDFHNYRLRTGNRINSVIVTYTY